MDNFFNSAYYILELEFGKFDICYLKFKFSDAENLRERLKKRIASLDVIWKIILLIFLRNKN